VRPGKCFRLCTQRAYEAELPAVSVPEMQRSELSRVILQLKALGIDSIMSFDWIAPPSPEAAVRALELLHALGALDEEGRLTSPVGLHLAEIPLHPTVSKALLVSGELGCAREMLTIAAVMSVTAGGRSVWQLGRGRRAMEGHKLKFAVAEGDHVTYLNIFKGFMSKSNRSSQDRSEWCRRNGLDHDTLARVAEVRRQLAALAARLGVNILTSCGQDTLPVKRALVHGLFANSAVLASASTDSQGRALYRAVRGGVPLKIHASSVLCRNQPSCVLYTSAVQTFREKSHHRAAGDLDEDEAAGGGAGALTSHEMFEVVAVEQDWLPEVAPHFYTQRKAA